MTVTKGSILEGVVKGITNFGAFVELPGGVTGLVHISEVADAYVKSVSDYLKEGDAVKVKVINVDQDGKIGLSIKQANPKYESKKPRRQQVRVQPQVSFEDKLAKFIKDSDERQADVKRQSEGKRGGRGSKLF
ncbi:MAG: RNA-binding protein S1 [Desulfitibacter sp. BRH_c19]|nr:MAG: RNA-binding protein S1 [Desulfitibacter sp. BRH_c19]